MITGSDFSAIPCVRDCNGNPGMKQSGMRNCNEKPDLKEEMEVRC